VGPPMRCCVCLSLLLLRSHSLCACVAMLFCARASVFLSRFHADTPHGTESSSLPMHCSACTASFSRCLGAISLCVFSRKDQKPKFSVDWPLTMFVLSPFVILCLCLSVSVSLLPISMCPQSPSGVLSLFLPSLTPSSRLFRMYSAPVVTRFWTLKSSSAPSVCCQSISPTRPQPPRRASRYTACCGVSSCCFRCLMLVGWLVGCCAVGLVVWRWRVVSCLRLSSSPSRCAFRFLLCSILYLISARVGRLSTARTHHHLHLCTSSCALRCAWMSTRSTCGSLRT
jgi:hypothetical protein